MASTQPSSSAPTQEASYSLLADSGFPSGPGAIVWPATGALLPSWEVETKPSPLEGATANLDAQGVLTLIWPNSAERVRLQQYLQLHTLPASPNGYDVHLQAICQGNFDTRSKIDWIAILELQPDGKSLYFHEKLPFSSIRLGNKVTILSAVHVERLDPVKQYCLSIQFKGSAGEIAFRSIRLLANPASHATPKPQLVYNQAKGTATTSPSQVLWPATKNWPLLNTPLARTDRPKALVIAWDLGHNPVGRAYLLAEVLAKTHEVTLVGPLFKRYGGQLWAPLASSELDIRTFPAETMADFLLAALPFIRQFNADVIYACKARLPSMLLGILSKYYTGAPIVLDVDDHELSFFADRRPLPLDEFITHASKHDDLHLPFGEAWTRMCETLVPCFDGVTVSNASLQDRFGGTIVRHARNEDKFNIDTAAREAVRAEFGYGEEDRVILFLGTPRAHKGVLRIAAAMRRLGDPRLRLCVIGTVNDRNMERKLADYHDVRIDLRPDRPWDELPMLIKLADGVCLLQDPTSPVAEYQIPAKLTDALATGVPVAATDVAPFRDIPRDLVTRIASEDDLDRFLQGVANGTVGGADFQHAARTYFLEELSYAAAERRLLDVFDASARDACSWPDEFTKLLCFLGQRSAAELPRETPFWFQPKAPAVHRDRPIDLAFFWKQNDTGIYGRRHDMLLRYLAQHDRIGRIVQFDAPISARHLNQIRLDDEAHLDQGNRVIAATLSRFLRTADSRNVARRVFVHRGRQQQETLLGVPLPPEEAYVDWVRQTLCEIAPSQSFVSWVTPVVFDYPTIHDQMQFAASIADLIDDQRPMTTSPIYRERLFESYAETLKRVDVVFANCGAAARAFSDIRSDAHVVTNAAEILPLGATVKCPFDLRSLTGPIIGYVGNLRDRIDFDLIRRMAIERPSWNIVLIGSAHGNPEVLRLRSIPNIRFLGVKTSDEATDYMRSFNVAIMPHVRNDVSAVMNPLKLYVYRSAGVPVVSTKVENIQEFNGLVQVAPDADAFIALVDSIIADPVDHVPNTPLPFEHSWNHRVEEIFRVIDAKLA